MGGHVFAGGSSPIRKEDIKPTLTRFIQDFLKVFPKAKGHFEGVKTLGSTGKKEVSGDIDLALDEKAFTNIKDWGLTQKEVDTYLTQFQKRARSASKQQLTKRAVICCIADKLEAESSRIKTDTKGSSNGTLFCQYPQFNSGGEFLDKDVQIDINIGDINWLSFAYYSDSYQGNVKGLHRTQLMLSLFTHKGYTFSHNYGVKNKETGELVASNPEQAINLLNSLYGFNLDQETLQNYFKLQEFLKNHLDSEELHAIWDRYLKILDSTRCDVPADLQEYWLDNQERLGLTGKFLPEDSKLYPFRDEDMKSTSLAEIALMS